MNQPPRPADAAPGGMGGSTRMHDPSEAAHDRLRRRCMNAAFVAIAILIGIVWRTAGIHGWDWLGVGLIVIGAVPAGLGVKVFELRFKMAREERVRILRELPRHKRAGFWLAAALLLGVLALHPVRVTWALLGIWLYDFVTYYHDRPERLRHLYAVTKTLDELRHFPAPWAWPVPAILFEIARRYL
jgi:hypothetical protein